MSDKRISLKKVGAGVVKANMKFWGGDKIPLLNGVTNFFLDPKAAIDKFKIPVSEKNALKTNFDNLDKHIKMLQQEELVLSNYKNGFLSVIQQLNAQQVSIIAASPSGFTNSVVYRLNLNLLKALNLDSVLNQNTYNGVSNAAPQQLRQSYTMLINKLKEIDQKVMQQINKLNTIKQSIKKYNNDVNGSINRYNNTQL